MRRARTVLTVRTVRLAPGRLRVGLGRAFAERGGLALAGANGLVQLPGQFRDLGREFGNLFGEIPAPEIRGLVHVAIVVKWTTSSRSDRSRVGARR
jgi:hypothetical protein